MSVGTGRTDGSPPELPRQIGVLIPGGSLVQRLAMRRLTRYPARRIALAATTAHPFGCPPSSWA
ncbi:hypothetical protein ABZ835_41960 [Streptomyces sp. NPDC047461]|uniref:hypothetical protein n=1 Tax=Streptomyces sp. NPDC047461 TaxID=3155619 RepID=UPI0033C66206